MMLLRHTPNHNDKPMPYTTRPDHFAFYPVLLGIVLFTCLMIMSTFAPAAETQSPDDAASLANIIKLQNDVNTINNVLKQTRTSLEQDHSVLTLHTDKIQENFDTMRGLLREVRTTATNLHTQRSLIEDNSIRLYEILLKINEIEEQVEAQINTFSLTISNAQDAEMDRIHEIKRIVGIDLKPLWMLLATFLVLLVPFAFTLNQTTQPNGYSTQLSPFTSQRALLISLSILVGYFVIGFGLSYGISIEGWVGKPLFFMDNSALITGDESAPQFSVFVLQHSGYSILGGMVVYLSLSYATPNPTRIGNRWLLFLPLIVGTLLIPAFSHLGWASQFLQENRGWLEAQGFIDQSGAIVVHVVSGFFAFIVLRRFSSQADQPQESNEPPPDNIQPIYTSATAMLLLLGWIGLAAGKLSVYGELIGPVMLNLTLAAAAGAIAAYLHASLFYTGNYPIALGVGGIVAGLVAISACVQSVTFEEALVIGLIAGLLQNIAFGQLRKWWLQHVWQAPGAQLVAIHGICGIWGGISIVLFGNGGSFSAINTGQLMIQVQGIGLAIAYGVVSAYILLVFKKREKTIEIKPATIISK